MDNEPGTAPGAAPPVALVTGASAGLGASLTRQLLARGWHVVGDGRRAERLRDLARESGFTAVPGDVADADHRAALAGTVADAGRLDLLVNNASTLGPLPMHRLADLTASDWAELLRVNVVAPVSLVRSVLAHLRRSRGVVVSVTSDAAAAHYPGWGGYAAGKAALEHATLTLAEEEPEIRWYAVDPGDMRTQMHQDAFPGEDISDRPLPDHAAAALMTLVEPRPPSGRYVLPAPEPGQAAVS